MIKLVRVDHRLVHGQVAFSWTNVLEANCILIASDGLMKDELRMTAMRMAKPASVKLVMKSMDDSISALTSGITDKYKLFIIVESIEDAEKLSLGYPEIKSINLGGTKKLENRRQISKAIFIDKNDEDSLRRMADRDIELEIRLVPTDKQENAIDLL